MCTDCCVTTAGRRECIPITKNRFIYLFGWQRNKKYTNKVGFVVQHLMHIYIHIAADIQARYDLQLLMVMEAKSCNPVTCLNEY